MTIRFRIFLGFIIIISLGFYLLSTWILTDLWPQPVKAMEDTLCDTAVILASVIETHPGENFGTTLDLKRVMDTAYGRTLKAQIYELEKSSVDLSVIITDERGTVVFDSVADRYEGEDFSEWHDIHASLRGEYGARTTRTDPDDIFSSVFWVSAPIYRKGRVAGVVSVGKPAKNVETFIQTTRRNVVIASLSISAAVLLLSLLISSWVTRPIYRLTEYARQVRDGKRVKLPDLGESELGKLGIAFEEMRDALEGKNTIESYVLNLTHEIKGPLASIRGASELLTEPMDDEVRKKFAGNIKNESQRIQKIIEKLLQLSVLEKRKELHDVEEINVDQLLHEVFESITSAYLDKALHLEKSGLIGIEIRGEKFLLRQAFSNLLINSADFIQDEGAITITGSLKDRELVIQILDTGTGIPEYGLKRIFERFYSLKRPGSKARSTGLGLSFVREIFTLHGGEISIENRPEGGVCATVRLPHQDNSV